ncbi:MAG: branched-chain amino acid ABC transporter permease [Acidimicrobiales bacterium]
MRDLLPFIIVGLASGSVYALAGTGLVLTYKTSGIFNFAHGTIAALMAFAFYDLRQRSHIPWPLALAICMLVLAPLAALALERMARRLADAPVAMKVVATVGLVVGIQQLIIIRYGAARITTRPFLPTRTFLIFGARVGIDQLIVMAIALAAMVGLTLVLNRTRLGRNMRAVVDNADLLAMTGARPSRVRRWAWYIGSSFAGLSGVLLAPTVGLDGAVLTLLVVQAFGAAAIGMFTNVPLTYVGGLVVGILAGLSTKWVATVPALNGLPPSLPFIVLFLALVLAPQRWLVDFTVERKAAIVEGLRLSRRTKVVGTVALVALVVRAPEIVGTRLPVYTSALGFVIILLSLALLMRTSGQVSLAQLAFAAVGAASAARLTTQLGVPWLLAILLGALIAVPVGALLAVPAIRRSGLYLALATFGFAVLMQQMLFAKSFMFGGNSTFLAAPRPDFATSDKAYFYVVVGCVVVAVTIVAVLHRSRLGRMLRAMADSPTALQTYGGNLILIKVAIFCVSAFLAGLGGALLGPVTGSASPAPFSALSSLQLIVVLALVPGSEITGAIGAAILLTIVPSYITSARLNDYLPVLFGASAVLVAMRHAGAGVPPWLARAAATRRTHPGRHPATARLATHPGAGAA